MKNYLHMSVPTASIITPSYNQIEYLRDSLDHIEWQTYDDIEHFVLDGGSTDGSRTIIKDHADQAAHDVCRSKPGDGQSAAINESSNGRPATSSGGSTPMMSTLTATR